MKLIERIKVNLRSAQMGERTVWSPDRIAALVEYYEAAEAWLDAPRFNCLKEKDRFEKARAALEKEEK